MPSSYVTRVIKPITVMVSRVDRNESDPGCNVLVSAQNPGGSGFSVILGAFDDDTAAIKFGQEMAERNGWSFLDRSYPGA